MDNEQQRAFTRLAEKVSTQRHTHNALASLVESIEDAIADLPDLKGYMQDATVRHSGIEVHLARLEQQQRDAAAHFDQFFKRLGELEARLTALETASS